LVVVVSVNVGDGEPPFGHRLVFSGQLQHGRLHDCEHQLPAFAELSRKLESQLVFNGPNESGSKGGIVFRLDLEGEVVLTQLLHRIDQFVNLVEVLDDFIEDLNDLRSVSLHPFVRQKILGLPEGKEFLSGRVQGE